MQSKGDPTKWESRMKGARVVLTNMKTKKYNGIVGLIHGPARDGRVVVRLTGRFAGNRISVKIENCNGFNMGGLGDQDYSLERTKKLMDFIQSECDSEQASPLFEKLKELIFDEKIDDAFSKLESQMLGVPPDMIQSSKDWILGRKRDVVYRPNELAQEAFESPDDMEKRMNWMHELIKQLNQDHTGDEHISNAQLRKQYWPTMKHLQHLLLIIARRDEATCVHLQRLLMQDIKVRFNDWPSAGTCMLEFFLLAMDEILIAYLYYEDMGAHPMIALVDNSHLQVMEDCLFTFLHILCYNRMAKIFRQRPCFPLFVDALEHIIISSHNEDMISLALSVYRFADCIRPRFCSKYIKRASSEPMLMKSGLFSDVVRVLIFMENAVPKSILHSYKILRSKCEQHALWTTSLLENNHYSDFRQHRKKVLAEYDFVGDLFNMPDSMRNKFQIMLCSNCGKAESRQQKLMACAGCGLQYYCSRKCQKKHWGKHKSTCKNKEWKRIRQRLGKAYCNHSVAQLRNLEKIFRKDRRL